ncbi:MAG: TetR/AcrR family transcriptional regulator [Pseudoxanthomonas sp.]
MQAAPTPSRAQLPQRVHQAVRELMCEQGLRVSMDAVALRAGCSKQTLYSRYGSKQALMRSVMQEHLDQTTAPLQDDEATPASHSAKALRQGLITFACEHLQRLSSPEVLACTQLMNAEARQFPEEARATFDDGHGRLLEYLARRLARAMRRGHLRHDHPHFAAELLLGMITGSDFERQRFMAPHRDTEAARRQWAEFAVDAFLRAFAPVATMP